MLVYVAVIAVLALVSLAIVPRYVMWMSLACFCSGVVYFFVAPPESSQDSNPRNFGQTLLFCFFAGAAIAIFNKLRNAGARRRTEKQVRGFSPAAATLADFARPNGNYTYFVGMALREVASELAEVNEGAVLLSDLATVLITVNGDSSTVDADLKMLQCFALRACIAEEPIPLYKLNGLVLEHDATDTLLTLDVLRRVHPEVAEKLQKAFEEFITEMLHRESTPEREMGAEQLRRALREDYPSEGAAKNVDEAVQSLQENIQALRQTLYYGLFDLTEECTPAELRSAYHRKVAEWHPDKLQGMAPELQELATERLAQLNEAYRELTAERAV